MTEKIKNQTKNNPKISNQDSWHQGLNDLKTEVSEIEKSQTKELKPAKKLFFPMPNKTIWALLGPSIVFVALSLNGGEMLLWPDLVSRFGLSMLWAIPVILILQFAVNMEIERYSTTTGQNILVGLLKNRIWLSIVFIISIIISLMWPAWISTAGNILAYTLGLGNLGAVFSLVLMLILLTLWFNPKSYNWMENIAKIGLCCILFISLFLVFRLFNAGTITASFAAQNYLPTEPDDRFTFLSALAFGGVAGVLNLVQSGWVLSKNYGIGEIREAVSKKQGENDLENSQSLSQNTSQEISTSLNAEFSDSLSSNELSQNTFQNHSQNASQNKQDQKTYQVDSLVENSLKERSLKENGLVDYVDWENENSQKAWKKWWNLLLKEHSVLFLAGNFIGIFLISFVAALTLGGSNKKGFGILTYQVSKLNLEYPIFSLDLDSFAGLFEKTTWNIDFGAGFLWGVAIFMLFMMAQMTILDASGRLLKECFKSFKNSSFKLQNSENYDLENLGSESDGQASLGEKAKKKSDSHSTNNLNTSKFDISHLKSSQISQIFGLIGCTVLIAGIIYPGFNQPSDLLRISASLSSLVMAIYPPMLISLNQKLPAVARPKLWNIILIWLCSLFYGVMVIWTFW